MTNRKPFLYLIIQPIVCGLIRLLYRPKFIGKERIPKNGRIILASNHISALDPFIVASSSKRTVHFLAKKELFWFPLKYILKSIGTIPVDRSKKDENATSEAEKFLNNNRLLCIFPEGTRGKNNDILPFKYGAVSLASKTDSLIVPVAIIGKYRIFRKGPLIHIGDPINIKDMDLESANEYLRESIIKLINEV